MKKQINIEGMSCGHCANHVKTALVELEGVTSANVDLAGKNALVELAKEVNDAALTEAVVEAGYEVISIQTL